MNAWIDTSLANGSAFTPGERRDHVLEGVGDFMYLVAGIDADEALMDMWSANFSRYVSRW